MNRAEPEEFAGQSVVQNLQKGDSHLGVGKQVVHDGAVISDRICAVVALGKLVQLDDEPRPRSYHLELMRVKVGNVRK